MASGDTLYVIDGDLRLRRLCESWSRVLNAYAPSDWSELWTSLAGLSAVLFFGYCVTRIRSIFMARVVSWLMVIVCVGGMEQYTVSQPAGLRMVLIISMLLYTMKVVVAAEVHNVGKVQLNFYQWIGFAGFWVGMRPKLFADVPRRPRTLVGGYFLRGFKNLLFGLALALVAKSAWIATAGWGASERLLITSTLLLPGLSLILHFGLFNWLTAFWRWQGAECEAVFREPLKSTSLTEFWGKRWNLAFSEMTTLAVFRPLRVRWGPTPAMLVSFVFSGLLHELAISVPVRAGFGWPLIYFLIHGLGMLIENRWLMVGQLIDARPWVGRLWTMTWLILPLPLLFHQPFLRGCIWPLIGIVS